MNSVGFRRVLFLAAMIFWGTPGLVLARPPSDVILSYDVEKKNLHIEVRHVSTNPRKHFIRKLLIDKNDKNVETRYYVLQTTGTTLIEDFPLEALTGDVLRVEAVCNEVGRKEATLVIP